MLTNRLRNVFLSMKEGLTGYMGTISSDHAYIHDGIGFSLPVEISLGSGATSYLSLTTPAATSAYIHFRPTEIVSTASAIKTYLYEDQSSTGGVNVTSKIVNRNRNSSTTTNVTAKSGVTVTVSGNPIQISAAGSSGGPTARAGGSTGADEEIVLKPESEYIVRIVEVGGSATTAIVTGFWYEEENGLDAD